MSLGPGSEDIDLSQLIVCISDATHTANVNYHLEKKNGVYVANNTATSDYFSISPIRIRDDTTFDPTHPVLRTGDVMEVTVDVRKVFKFGGEYPDPAHTGLPPEQPWTYRSDQMLDRPCYWRSQHRDRTSSLSTYSS